MTEKRDIFAETGIKRVEEKKVAPVSERFGIRELKAQPPAKPRPFLERLADVPEKLVYKGREFVREAKEDVRESAPVVASKVKEIGKGIVEYAQAEAPQETVVRPKRVSRPKKIKRKPKKAPKKSSGGMYDNTEDSIYDMSGTSMYPEEMEDMWGSTEVDMWGNRAERKSKNMLDEEVL